MYIILVSILIHFSPCWRSNRKNIERDKIIIIRVRRVWERKLLHVYTYNNQTKKTTDFGKERKLELDEDYGYYFHHVDEKLWFATIKLEQDIESLERVYVNLKVILFYYYIFTYVNKKRSELRKFLGI